MLVNEDYKLESDQQQFILFKKHYVKGEDVWVAVGYYSTLRSALESMAMKEIFGTGLKDVEKVAKKIEELKKAIGTLGIVKASHLEAP